MNSHSETISIIVPVYNAAEYLKTCVDSILRQSYRDLEIILVDDGSTDASGRICDSYGVADSRVRVIHKENSGAADARNCGLEISSGGYIGFVDSDDWIDDQMYSVLHRLLQDFDVDIASCGRKLSTESDRKTAHSVEIVRKHEALESTFYPKRIQNSVWDKLFRRKVFDELRFRSGSFAEDTPVVYRAIHQHGDMVYTSQRLYHYRIRDGSVTTSRFSPTKLTHVEMYRERIAFMDIHYPEFRALAYRTFVMHMNGLFLSTARFPDRETFAKEHANVLGEIRAISLRDGLLNRTIPLRARLIHGFIRAFPGLAEITYEVRQRI